MVSGKGNIDITSEILHPRFRSADLAAPLPSLKEWNPGGTYGSSVPTESLGGSCGPLKSGRFVTRRIVASDRYA
jgi:hypothetical protein